MSSCFKDPDYYIIQIIILACHGYPSKKKTLKFVSYMKLNRLTNDQEGISIGLVDNQWTLQDVPEKCLKLMTNVIIGLHKETTKMGWRLKT